MFKDLSEMPSRIMIVGCCGAGKSTLAKQIQQKTGLPIIILDEYYYSENWAEPSKEEWNKEVKALSQRTEYIMDGNYGSSMHIRLPHADLIVFLDHPTYRLLFRVLRRTWKNLGKTRSGMPAGCPERFDLAFLHYVLSFNFSRKKDLLNRISQYAPDTPFITLQNNQDINYFLDKIAVSAETDLTHH